MNIDSIVIELVGPDDGTPAYATYYKRVENRLKLASVTLDIDNSAYLGSMTATIRLILNQKTIPTEKLQDMFYENYGLGGVNLFPKYEKKITQPVKKDKLAFPLEKKLIEFFDKKDKELFSTLTNPDASTTNAAAAQLSQSKSSLVDEIFDTAEKMGLEIPTTYPPGLPPMPPPNQDGGLGCSSQSPKDSACAAELQKPQASTTVDPVAPPVESDQTVVYDRHKGFLDESKESQ